MSVPRYWREIPQRYRLESSRCNKCGNIQIPPFAICSRCRSTDIQKEISPTTGKVITFTVVWTPPKEFSGQAPYVLAIVELDNGARLTGQITDCDHDTVKSGMKIEVIFRRINSDGAKGLIRYGYKFRPIDSLK